MNDKIVVQMKVIF